jgi:hypothetical protein
MSGSKVLHHYSFPFSARSAEKRKQEKIKYRGS